MTLQKVSRNLVLSHLADAVGLSDEYTGTTDGNATRSRLGAPIRRFVSFVISATYVRPLDGKRVLRPAPSSWTNLR